ncbi:AsmA family protein [Flavitalea sp.]|nr:AsmA family protein [Flavitalea sp.]
MKKTLRYILKGTGILIGVLLIFWLIVIAYVSINKKEIIAKVTGELNERMNATVIIGGLDPSFFQTFPFLSLRLSDISLRDSLWDKHHHDFLKAEKFFIRMNPLSLFSASPKINKIIVEKGSIYLFTDTSNYTNAYIMNAKKKTTRRGLKPPFNGIELKEVRLTFVNPYRGKLFDFDIKKLVCEVDSEDSSTVLGIKTDLFVHDLAFNTDRGVFLKEKRVEGKFAVTLDQQIISIDRILLRLDGQPFEISALFELGTDPKFKLDIASNEAKYRDLIALLTERLQKKLDTFGVSNTLDVTASLKGSLLPKTIPLVNVKWTVKGSDLKTPAGDFMDCSLDGSFTNQADTSLSRNDSNSVISINSFKGTWEKILLSSSKFLVTDLGEPKMAFDLHTNVELKYLNDLTGIESFEFSKGKADVNINFSGPVMSSDTGQTLISGGVDISEGELTYLPRALTLSGCKGSLIFDKKDVYIKDLRANTKRSDLLIGGKIDNFLSMLNKVSENMLIDLNINSSKLDLTDFTQNLQKRHVTSKQKNTARLLKIANKIDKMIAESAMKIDLSAKKVQYKKFAGTNVKAALILEKDDWNLKNISMNHADGTFVIDGKLKTNGSDNPFSIRGKMDNIDISKVFYSFNNFSLDGLTDKNIKGVLTADFDIAASINNKSEIVPYSIHGFVNMSLKDGALQNFEPMQKISNSVFKNRDMSDIRFAELKDNLQINGTSITINSMEIQSTVLTMFIEGTYDMKAGPDMSILVPLSNLKKRGSDFELVNKGTDSKKGLSVHLRARYGDDGKVKISWDPFKKALKNKDKKVAAVP